MIQKIDVLMPTASLYEVQHHFTLKFYDALVRAGYECRLLHGKERFYTPLNDPPDLTVAFNGAAITEAGDCLADHIRVPHVACLTDPPYRFLNLTGSRYMIITCDDKFCTDLLKIIGFNEACFMPHAVEKELCEEAEKDKIYDIAMLATFIDIEKRREAWREKFSKPVYQALEEAVEMSLTDNPYSFLWTVQKQLFPHLRGKDNRPDENLLYQIFEEAELYIKGKDRIDLIQSIQDHPVHLFGGSIDEGSSWEKFFKDHKQVIVHPPVPFLQGIEVMKQTKILLNSSIKNKQGAHERIFTGAACGAVIVTNDTPYLHEQFLNEEEMILFKQSELSDINDKVNRLLADEKKRRALATRSKEKVLQLHTWDTRVSNLMSEIQPFVQSMRSL